MALEPGFYIQVVMIRRNYVNNKKYKYNTNKYNFQGRSAISIRWFYIDHKWSEEKLSTHKM